MHAPGPDVPTAAPSTDPAEWSSRTLAAACVLTVALAFGVAAALAGLSESASGQQGFGPGQGQLPGQGRFPMQQQSPMQQQNVPRRGRTAPGPQQRTGQTPTGTPSNGSAPG